MTGGRNKGRLARVCGPMIELRRASPFLAFALALLMAGCSLLPAPLDTAAPTELTADPTQPEAAVAASTSSSRLP